MVGVHDDPLARRGTATPAPPRRHPTPTEPITPTAADLVRLQRVAGNQATTTLLASLSPSMTVGAVDDPAEREADRLADEVVAGRDADPECAGVAARAPVVHRDDTIRRAVGFEFEDPTWSVFKLQAGNLGMRDPKSYLPWHWGGGTNAPAPENDDPNLYGAPEGTHVNDRVGAFDLQGWPGGTAHEGTGYTIEPDGPYSLDGVTGRMDVEFVTDPFPETAQGAEALEAALADMRMMFGRIDGGAVGKWNGKTEGLAYDKFLGPDQHGFSKDDVYLYGGKKGGAFKPQVTAGMSLAKLPHVMETLGVSAPNEQRDEEKDAVRGLVYGESDPAKLVNTSITKTMGTAPGRARTVVANLVQGHVLDADTPGVADLTGFLSLAIVYMSVLSDTSKDGIKTGLPLMSRYSFAKLWTQIPAETRTAFAAPDALTSLMNGLGPAVAASVREYLTIKFKDGGVIGARRGTGMDDQMLYLQRPDRQYEAVGAEPDRDYSDLKEVAPVLDTMTRRDWLWHIVTNGLDTLNATDLLSLLGDSDHQAVAQKHGASIGAFFRGHGDSSNVQEVGDEAPEELALLENRNITKVMTFNEVEDMARRYFSWMKLLKEHGPEG